MAVNKWNENIAPGVNTEHTQVVQLPSQTTYIYSIANFTEDKWNPLNKRKIRENATSMCSSAFLRKSVRPLKCWIYMETIHNARNRWIQFFSSVSWFVVLSNFSGAKQKVAKLKLRQKQKTPHKKCTYFRDQISTAVNAFFTPKTTTTEIPKAKQCTTAAAAAAAAAAIRRIYLRAEDCFFFVHLTAFITKWK